MANKKEKKVDCPTCDGEGNYFTDDNICPDCKGKGKVTPKQRKKLIELFFD